MFLWFLCKLMRLVLLVMVIDFNVNKGEVNNIEFITVENYEDLAVMKVHETSRIGCSVR